MTAPFYDNSLADWIVAAAIAAVAMLLVFILKMLLRRRLRNAAQTTSDLDDFALDLVNHTRLLLLLFPVIYLSCRALVLPSKAESVLRIAAMLGFLVQVALWANEFTEFWFRRYKRTHADDPSAVTTIAAVGFLARVVLWVLIFVVALDNLGFNVTALVTGLGIGGIAVALATQNILADLFASLSIVVDKPFVIGDTIAVDDHAGTVEYVGLKTTRLRSINGEQLIFSNAELLKSRIRNLRRMQEKRVVMKMALPHDTPDEALESMTAVAREAVESHGGARFGGVQLLAVTPQAIDCEIVYHVPAAEALVLQSMINLHLFTAIRRNGASFPQVP